MFGGTKVFKYTLVKKTYDLKKTIINTRIDPVTISDETNANSAIKEALVGKLLINGKPLDMEYYNVSYDASQLQSGKTLKVTITGAVVNGVQVYSGFKTISIKIAAPQTTPPEETSPVETSPVETSPANAAA